MTKTKYLTVEVATDLANRVLKRARRIRLLDADGWTVCELVLRQAPQVAVAQQVKRKARK